MESRFHQQIMKMLLDGEQTQICLQRRQAETARRKRYRKACQRLERKIEKALRGADLREWARE